MRRSSAAAEQAIKRGEEEFSGLESLAQDAAIEPLRDVLYETMEAILSERSTSVGDMRIKVRTAFSLEPDELPERPEPAYALGSAWGAEDGIYPLSKEKALLSLCADLERLTAKA